jgi:hypothetical protein
LKLESARALKESLRAEDEHMARAFNIDSPKALRMPRPKGVALGVAPRKSGEGYALAVRVDIARPGLQEYVAGVAREARDEVDVRYTGRIRAFARQRPLRSGISVAHQAVTAGTLGCFVRCRRDRSVGILSNNHVLANENDATEGDAILQPGPRDGGTPAQDRIGRLARFVALDTAAPNQVDAAFAVLDEGIAIDNGSVPIAGVADDPADYDEVEKVGRTTGHTNGHVGAFELDGVRVHYASLGVVTFDGVFEVTGAFSAPGDSGSVIVGANDRMAVGLLFAGTDQPLTYGNPFADVLRALDTDLLETET